MMRFKIPQKMKEWSIWALWWLLIAGAVFWLLVGSVAYWVKQGWLPPDVAGWAQAIGAILAIVGAGAFPFWHGHVKEKRNQQRTIELLRAISNHIRGDLSFLLDFLCCQAFGGFFEDEQKVDPELVAEGARLKRPRIWTDDLEEASDKFLDFMKTKIHTYRDGGHASEWAVHRTILNDISAAHLWSANLLHHIFHLKKAVEAGALVAGEIEEICSSKELFGARLRLVKMHFTQIELDVGRLRDSKHFH
ncbi:MAG: hypothetical protein ACN6O6_15755 [Pseudomonas sp.]|uniref:hypothetical protein n=1 Tax=Pseudomonas sp. TaxID=306 RepID=UPI003D0C818E